jgi:hypothetical protein
VDKGLNINITPAYFSFSLKFVYSASETAEDLGLNYTNSYDHGTGIFLSDIFYVRLVWRISPYSRKNKNAPNSNCRDIQKVYKKQQKQPEAKDLALYCCKKLVGRPPIYSALCL